MVYLNINKVTGTAYEENSNIHFDTSTQHEAFEYILTDSCACISSCVVC